MPTLYPATIDQDTDIVAVLEDLLHKSLDLIPVREICGVNRRSTPESTNLISRACVAVVSLHQNYV
jgi:hypothetical protein